MAIYRCSQCGLVRESLAPANTKTACERCATPAAVYDTVYFVEAMLKRLAAINQELKALKQAPPVSADGEETTAPAAATPAAPAPRPAAAPLARSLQDWFSERKIEVQLDDAAADTSGFFDDAAVQLGDGHELFGELIDRVRFAYRKGHSSVNLDLSKLAQKDAQAINTLCRNLYEHTFFSRYHYLKAEKLVRLNLQPAPAVRQFFEGSWLEWYALMSVMGASQQAKLVHARSVKVVFPNEDLHELDVVCLPAGQAPICIECKSGEFRRDIDKYMRLRKRLGIDRSRFLICSTDLSQEQAAGLSAMYELTFVNLQTLKPHLQGLLGH